MIIQASNGCFLTQSEDVAFKERRFEKSVLAASMKEASLWKEIPESEKAQMEAENSIYEPDTIDYDYLKKVDALRNTISDKINESFMPAEEALEMKEYFPVFEDLIGDNANVGFRFQYKNSLYEVIKSHVFSSEWLPDAGTESLYKVVQIEATGTKEDPIVWEKNMELVEGLYYTENDVLYQCTRSSGIALSFTLAELVGLYVTVVDETTPSNPDGNGEEQDKGEDADIPIAEEGTLENPINYEKGVTSIVKGLYYSENGKIYKAIQDGGVLIYNLSDIPAIAQEVK